MAKRRRTEQLFSERQRRTMLMLVDGFYGIDAVAERFGLSLEEAAGAVATARNERRAATASGVDWRTEFEQWQTVG